MESDESLNERVPQLESPNWSLSWNPTPSCEACISIRHSLKVASLFFLSRLGAWGVGACGLSMGREN